MRVSLVAAAAILVGTVSATATTTKPLLSGPYIVTLSETCYYSDGSNSTSQTVGVITFNATSNWATAKFFQNRGNPPTTASASGGAKFHNTDKTLELDGTTYNAFYGGITAENIATQVSYLGIISGGSGITCEDQGTLTHQ